MSEKKHMAELQDRIDRLHQSIPPSMAGHRKDKCDVCYLINSYDSLKARVTKLEDMLSGIVVNHDQYDLVDESWWVAARKALANEKEPV